MQCRYQTIVYTCIIVKITYRVVFKGLVLRLGAFRTRTQTRTHRTPNDTEADASGRSVRVCDARESNTLVGSSSKDAADLDL